MSDTSWSANSASVCLDGAEVKRLRESQKLTQLYVSKVVGVTTDTISRWENNRYPTIRRDNALKLAEALEVPLELLLRKEDEDVESSAPSSSGTPKKLFIWVALGSLLLTAVLFLTMRTVAPPMSIAVEAHRDLPRHAAPGFVLPVVIELSQSIGEGGFILREHFPKGWQMLQAAPPASSLDNVNGVARWIIKSGERLERISYLLQVIPETLPGVSQSFEGEVVAGGDRNPTVSSIHDDKQIMVAPVHWADDNADGIVDDGEMLQASFLIEEMAGVHIDWDRLEALWDAGGYRWDAGEESFVPQPPLSSEVAPQ
ncbi:MAG: XRE family transcriptional regulator [Desulfuromonas sp.]|nr:MAG: XRE family transcriptional regulator [Desulfuromonas sp.]